MACRQRNGVLLLVLVAAVCLEVFQAQHFPGRCSCHSTVTLKSVKGNLSDFQVLDKRPGCDKTELIVTLNVSGNATDKFCINTEGKMARAFLRCWEKINKDEGRKTECIDKKRKAEDRTAADN